MESLSLTLISTIVAASLTAFLGILIWLHDKDSATNKIFIIHSFLGAVWAVINYLSVVTPAEHVLPWIRLVIFCAVPHVFLFFLFVYNFPHRNIAIKYRYFIPILLLMSLMMGLTLSNLIFSRISVINGEAVPVIGPLMPFFGTVLVIFFILTAILTVYKYFHSEQDIKKPWFAIGSGLLVSYTLLIFFVFLKVVLSNDTTFVRYSPLFILPIFICTAYAILKHHLFNIRIIAAEILVFILLLASFIEIAIAPSTPAFFLAISVTTFILISSILLTQSVLREVRQREQLQVLTKKLEEANQQMRALDKARADFISIASHQLRTPPATIKWYLGAILSGDYGPLDSEVKDVLQKTERTNNLQISLIDDLLNVSRIERGKMEFLFEPTDIQQLAEVTFEQLQPIAQEKGLELSFKRPMQKLPVVMADKEKLRQVINNLMDNAIKYTKQGCVIIGLNLTPKNEIRFQVTDTGKGISPETIHTIFEKYTRGKNSVHESTGLGLGLYVAKVIIQQHKGKIWADSPGEGKGSTFSFSIPVDNDLKQTTLLDLAAPQDGQKAA